MYTCEQRREKHIFELFSYANSCYSKQLEKQTSLQIHNFRSNVKELDTTNTLSYNHMIAQILRV
jgi:hypothetical protein